MFADDRQIGVEQRAMAAHPANSASMRNVPGMSRAIHDERLAQGQNELATTSRPSQRFTTRAQRSEFIKRPRDIKGQRN